MRIFSEGVHDHGLRTQPWTDSNHLSPGKYYCFREKPELIRTHLEEFVPFDKHEGVQNLYSLIERLNDSKSPFESNDARLEPRFLNQQRHLADRVHGRIFILGFFFRELILNLAADSSWWHHQYESHQIDEEQFRIAPNALFQSYIANFNKIVERSSGNSWPQIIGIGTSSTFYEFAPVPDSLKYGCQFFIRAWLWGNDDAEIFRGLGNVVDTLSFAMVKSIPAR